MSVSEVQPHPVFAQRLAAVAEGLERAGQLAHAAELFELAASLTPRGEKYRQRAAILRKAAPEGGDPEREHKRQNLEASHAVGMAHVLEANGELGRAHEMFDLAKLRAPFHYLAYAGAGYLHLRRRDLRAALEEFVQARRLNPLDRKLAVEAARVALELEDYQEALRHAGDAHLLCQGLGEAEELTARRRFETLGNLCKMGKEQLAEFHRQRAAALQRACEQVALTKARLFSTLTTLKPVTHRTVSEPKREELLRLALELRRFRVFRHFTDSQVVQLVQIGRKEGFRHAQVLAREGETERDVFVILKGTVHASRQSPVGAHVLATLSTGDIAGEISYLDSRSRSSSLLGVEAGLLLFLPAKELDELAAGSSELAVAMLWAFWHSLAAKVRAANAAMSAIFAPGIAPRRGRPGKPGERVVLDPVVKMNLLKEKGLSPGEQRLLATYSEEEKFPPDALIFAEGEQGGKLYIVVEGSVRISRQLPGVGEEALTVCEPGEVFGEMALIDEHPRSADARAHVGGAIVFSVDRQRLEEVLEMDPDAARQFLTVLCQILCRRVRAMNERLVAWRLMAGHE